MDGWVKLHRQILDNPIACKDSDYFSVWCYLLLNATHKERKVIFGKETITLKKGQLITGRKVISSQFNIDESKVQRILKKLEIEQQIEQQTNNKNRLVTVLNWDIYQVDEQQVEQQVNNKCTTTEQQVNTNKNERKKECKNERHYTSDFLEVWDLYQLEVGKEGNKETGFENFKEVIKEFNLDQIKKAILKYGSDNKETEKRYLKNAANFFDVEYISQIIIKIQPVKTLKDTRFKGLTPEEIYFINKAEAEARGERYGE